MYITLELRAHWEPSSQRGEKWMEGSHAQVQDSKS